MTSQPTRIGWLDVHAHYVTDHYAEACHAAGHGRPDGMPGRPDRLLYGSDFPFTPAPAITRHAAELRRACEPLRARLDLGPEAPASVLFPRLLSATKGSP